MAIVGYRIGPRDPKGQGYLLELFDPATGQRTAPAAGPGVLTDAELNTGPWTPTTIRQAFESPGTIKKDLLDAGRAMFGWLAAGEVGAAWKVRREAGDLTVLEVDTALADLPWELLADGFIQIFGVHRIARFHSVRTAQTSGDDWPLRLWIVKGTDEPSVHAADEIRRIRAELLNYRHSVDIDVSVPADVTAFKDRLVDFRPHILHFIGHSGQSNASGLPALFINAKTPWELDAPKINSVLTDSTVTPRVVFLNACHTASRLDAYAIADVFSAADVPATVTMQGAVPGDLAGRFAAAVYRQLADGSTDIVDAVRRSRDAIDSAQVPQTWAFPVLSLATSPADLLPKRPAALDTRFDAIEQCRIFQDVRLFSGRVDERRQLRTAVCPITTNKKPRHLLIVVGESHHGKSHLVKRCLECLTLRGHNTQYVEVADRGTKNELQLFLDMFRREQGDPPFPELSEAFNRFKWGAQQIIQRGVVTPWDGASNVDEPKNFDPSQLRSENARTLLADAALDALRGAATPAAPLFLVFDQFSQEGGGLAVPDSLFRDFLWPTFFDRIYKGEVQNLHVALVLRRGEAEDVYRLHEKIGREQWFGIDDLRQDEFDDLVDELFGYFDLAVDERDDFAGLDDVARGFKQKLGKGRSTAAWLKLLVEVADKVVPDSAHRRRVGRSK